MVSLLSFRMLLVGTLFLGFSSQILAQGTGTSSATTSSATTAQPASGTFSTPPITGGTTTRPPLNSSSTALPSVAATSTPPDVYLNVPELHVGRIELDVEELQADINLNAKVAGLVTVNAGVMVSVQKINVTITDVDANLELIVRLGHLVEIVERVFESLDLNPLLIGLINNVTSLVGEVIGAVDGLLGSITQGGKTLNFLVDNLGNIVQEVVGGATGALSSIVGNYQQNMTQVGDIKQLGNGLIQKTFSYAPLSALVDIVFNTAGQVVQATVQKSSGGGGTTSTPVASSTAMPVTLPIRTPISTS
ncbi:uncharacterized protein BDR25DRAFT_391217 [Lindgomyces ingoldianus]|uniref:Uncharacterized protein n=1 Tax=Lindgomyces ingoldianus TaxID=673940 RepID=A0ACB6RAG2_9PLEO|nr:uncharacterized protein BDR25DRAFT_391217 [Lindgomyces ingoldianus]KAF2475720.1 hypothetical protein BDR25DRAFT_391217 [Lindgomyces ingoldianus]